MPALLTVRSICSDADPILGRVILVDHEGFAFQEISSGDDTSCQESDFDIHDESSTELMTQPSFDSQSGSADEVGSPVCSVRATPELKAKIRMRLASLMRAMIRTEVSRTSVKKRRLKY
jgi:hypothetical protein